MPDDMLVRDMSGLMAYLDSKVSIGLIKQIEFMSATDPEATDGYNDILLTGVTPAVWRRVLATEVRRYACVGNVVMGEGHVMPLGSVKNGYIYPGPFVRFVIRRRRD